MNYRERREARAERLREWVERLEERLAVLEAERDRIKAYNASARKAAKTGGVGDVSLLDEKQRADLLSVAKYAPFKLRAGNALPAHKLSNLSGNIKRNRDRLAELRAVVNGRDRADKHGDDGGSAMSADLTRPTIEERDQLREARNRLETALHTIAYSSSTRDLVTARLVAREALNQDPCMCEQEGHRTVGCPEHRREQGDS